MITEKPEPEIKDNRTVRDFVEELILDGRSPESIMAVAKSCRWNSQLSAVKDVLEEFSNF